MLISDVSFKTETALLTIHQPPRWGKQRWNMSICEACDEEQEKEETHTSAWLGSAPNERTLH